MCSRCQQVTLGDVTGLSVHFDKENSHYSMLAIYRSPAMICDTILDDLQTYCDSLENNIYYILIDDTIINTLIYSKDKDHYLNIFQRSGFVDFITKPT